MANDDRFNPASASRDMFTEAITRALGDMTDAQIEALVQSAVGTEMSQRQMADLNLQSALETAVSAIRSEMTQKASTSDVTAAVADEAAARQAADAELHDAVGAVAALGAKNLLKVTSTTQTINGVTFTVNADQTVSLSGTATATATFVIVDNATSNAIPDGSYILTGCPSGGGNNTYDLRWYLYSSGKSTYDQGSGASVNKTGNTTSSNIAILIRSGVNTDGLVFRPMLRNSEITDAAYVPYAPTNRELYEMILALQSGVSAQSSAASLMQAGRLDAELTDAQEVTDDA